MVWVGARLIRSNTVSLTHLHPTTHPRRDAHAILGECKRSRSRCGALFPRMLIWPSAGRRFSSFEEGVRRETTASPRAKAAIELVGDGTATLLQPRCGAAFKSSAPSPRTFLPRRRRGAATTCARTKPYAAATRSSRLLLGHSSLTSLGAQRPPQPPADSPTITSPLHTDGTRIRGLTHTTARHLTCRSVPCTRRRTRTVPCMNLSVMPLAPFGSHSNSATAHHGGSATPISVLRH